MDKPYTERKAGSFVKDQGTGELRPRDETSPATVKPDPADAPGKSTQKGK